MSERPQLSLGPPSEALQKKLRNVAAGLAAVDRVAQLGRCGLSGGAAAAAPAHPPQGLPALPRRARPTNSRLWPPQLEDKSLDAEAARAWEAYLAADPQCAERAEICYRIGRLHMQAEQFGPAAAALVRAEQAAGDDKDLKAKIGPRIVECLNRLGRYGEVGRELSRRVEAGARTRRGEKPGQKGAGHAHRDKTLPRPIWTA